MSLVAGRRGRDAEREHRPQASRQEPLRPCRPVNSTSPGGRLRAPRAGSSHDADAVLADCPANAGSTACGWRLAYRRGAF